jgi:hypothetical protein
MAALREGTAVPATDLDVEALESLVADGLAVSERGLARLP